jgi:hypothetical protein
MTQFAAVIVLVAVVITVVPAVASAHWIREECNGTRQRIRFGASSIGLHIPSYWSSKDYNASNDARQNLNNATQFTYSLTTADNARTWFRRTNEGGNDVPGVTVISINDSCYIIKSRIYYNSYYIDRYTQAKQKAVAIHELGHSIGMEHFKDGCQLRSMMQGTLRCLWGVMGINTVQRHDIPEINGMY